MDRLGAGAEHLLHLFTKEPNLIGHSQSDIINAKFLQAKEQEGDHHVEPAKDQCHREENNDAITPPVFLLIALELGVDPAEWPAASECWGNIFRLRIGDEICWLFQHPGTCFRGVAVCPNGSLTIK